MSTWIRTVQANLTWTAGTSLIAKVTRGDTLLRIHFGWGFYGSTHSVKNPLTTGSNLQVMGLVTTVGTGTETVPNPRINPADQSPPSERWLWWEARGPIMTSYDSAAEFITWRDSGPQQPLDVQAQVTAKTIPVGDTVNLWASWAAAGAWETNEANNLWYWASILYA
jgi:hypothetical protein